MEEQYRSDLKAHVSLDSSQRVCAIRHSQEYWLSSEPSVMATAISYLNNMASVYDVPKAQLANMQERVNYLNPREQGVEYRLSEEKSSFDSTTFGFYQTYMNTPVWQAGFKVTIKQGPNRVIRSVNTSQTGIDAAMPPQEIVDTYKRLFSETEVKNVRRRAGEQLGESEEDEGTAFVRRITGIATTAESGSAETEDRMRLIRGRFWIYQYDVDERFDTGGIQVSESEPEVTPTLSLPPVDDSINDGQYYLVAEVTFSTPAQGFGMLNWRALVELGTESVLYLRPLVGFVNGKVFVLDPISSSGTTKPKPDQKNTVLNSHRSDVTLPRLDAPVASKQSLKGSYVEIKNIDKPDINPPKKNTGTDFDYDARTNDFAAVSAYYHTDKLFDTIVSLGWSPLSKYFSKTSFPVPVDHRACLSDCPDGHEINGACFGDGTDGIEKVVYMLNDLTDTTNPLGRAADPRIHWHEVCGHGVLYETVGSPNFNFAHSAGDGLSGIFYDPESKAKGVDGKPVGKPGNLRFTYVPWHPSLDRRFDRDVSAGWAWGGSQDDSGYSSEQILATTHFRIYRAIGGDSANLGRQQFASRMMIYLILRAIKNLTSATNPKYAREFAAELMAVDKLNWTSEGIYGGAYNKVIRWAFEKQGEYQTPLVTRSSKNFGKITTSGDPPNVDVYIDDGRAGEYEYIANHWHTTTVWNRRASDGLANQTHQQPLLGATNYIYVKVKNRGTQVANNVVVKGYHTKPGAGLLWPTDFQAFTTPQLSAGTIAANNTQEKIVGPFSWTPNLNTYGHDCLLMIVSADGDPSNVDNFTAGEVIPLWRLVPNDNNIVQRNVYPAAGGGGSEGLLAELDGVSFWVGNPNPGPTVIELQVDLPDLLRRADWFLTFEGISDNRFQLASGEKREVVMRLNRGANFTREQVEQASNRDIEISVFADDNPIGGMTYRLDPTISEPINKKKPEGFVISNKLFLLLLLLVLLLQVVILLILVLTTRSAA